MKMLDVKNAEKTLSKLTKADLPVAMSFKLISFIDEVDKHLTTFETIRVQLIKKYGTVDKNKNIEVKKDAMGDFNKDINELLNTDITITANPISSEKLIDVEDLTLSISEIKALQNIGIIDG